MFIAAIRRAFNISLKLKQRLSFKVALIQAKKMHHESGPYYSPLINICITLSQPQS